MPLASPFLPAGVATGLQQAAAQKQQQNPLVPQQQELDVAANSAQWDKVLQALVSPGTISALTGFGARMLQPLGPGQTTGGLLGQSILGTIGDQQKLMTAESERANRKTLTDLEKRRTKVAERGADLAERKQGMAEEAQPLELEKLSAEIAKLRSDARGGGSEAGATERVIDRLAQAFYRSNPGKFASMDEAFTYAAKQWKATQGKSTEDVYQGWLQTLNSLPPAGLDTRDPDYFTKLKELAWELTLSSQDNPSNPRGAPAGTAPGAPQGQPTAPAAATRTDGMPDPTKYQVGTYIRNPKTGDWYNNSSGDWQPSDAPPELGQRTPPVGRRGTR